ncbi:MAG: hypothetical protein QXZ44_06940 [Ferroplasma sp.]
MEVIWISNIGIIIIEFAIFLWLTISYIGDYKKTGARVYSQIFVFSLIFLAQSSLTLYVYYSFSRFLHSDVSIPLLIINLLGVSGMIFLLKFLKQ